MLTVAGTDHIITMDLHASQIQGFFDIPGIRLSSLAAYANITPVLTSGLRFEAVSSRVREANYTTNMCLVILTLSTFNRH